MREPGTYHSIEIHSRSANPFIVLIIIDEESDRFMLISKDTSTGIATAAVAAVPSCIIHRATPLHQQANHHLVRSSANQLYFVFVFFYFCICLFLIDYFPSTVTGSKPHLLRSSANQLHFFCILVFASPLHQVDSSVDQALQCIFAYLDLGFTGMALSGRVEVDIYIMMKCLSVCLCAT